MLEEIISFFHNSPYHSLMDHLSPEIRNRVVNDIYEHIDFSTTVELAEFDMINYSGILD